MSAVLVQHTATMSAGRGAGGVFKISDKKGCFLSWERKKQISPLLPTLEKFWKNPLVPPLEKILPTPMTVTQAQSTAHHYQKSDFLHVLFIHLIYCANTRTRFTPFIRAISVPLTCINNIDLG